MDMSVFIDAFVVIIILAILTWLLSVVIKDVSIVDSAWSLMFLSATLYVYFNDDFISTYETILLGLIFVWAARLAIYLTWRNWGEDEDKRYQDIREKYSPNFAFKSLFIIFVFQAVLAAIIVIPVIAVFTGKTLKPDVGVLQYIGGAIFLLGFVYESVADMQLSSFKANPDNKNKVMNAGLWKHTRHPNYFGESLVWWGIYLFTLEYTPWWVVISPLLITWLLLKFSGVVMLEETITKRRPDYQAYIDKTNAFIPGLVKE